MTASELERLQQELAREREARAHAEARLNEASEELRRSVSAFQEMALRHQDALVRLAGLSPDAAGLTSVNREITKVAAETIGVERASLWFLSPDGAEMRCEELYERGPDRYSHGVVLKASDYPRYFAALKLGRAIDGHDARRDPRTSEFSADYLTPLGITSMLDAAIRIEGRVVGVVCLEHVGEARTWTAAEIFSTTSLGYGTYQWQIDGTVDHYDRNVVVGLFPYGPAAGLGASGNNEIDIEYARWGNDAWPNGNFTVWPPPPLNAWSTRMWSWRGQPVPLSMRRATVS